MKMFIIGLLIGITLMLALGAYVPQTADFGFAVPSGGWVIIKDNKGQLYRVNATSTIASRIQTNNLEFISGLPVVASN